MSLIVNHHEDGLDSRRDDIQIIDSSTLEHPQGPVVVARMNVPAFAPHLEEQVRLAHLFAAAPDLLKALENALVAIEYYHDHEGCPSLLTAVKSAIAKAQGK